MGFFKSLRNSLRKDNVKSSVQLVNSSGNYFTAWDGRVFDNDIVRGAINARAKRISKVELKHCFKPPNGKLEKVNEDANYRFLLEEPNPYMTMPDFLDKLSRQSQLNGNAFALILRDDNGIVRQLYPIPASNAESKYDESGNLHILFSLTNGQRYQFSYEDIIHIREDYYENDIFGMSKFKALSPLMNVITTMDQGIIAAVKNSAIIRWLLKVHSATRPEDVKRHAQEFADNYLSISNSAVGVAAVNTTMDATQITPTDYVPNAAQVEKTKSRILNLLNTNEKIIQSTATEDEENNYYEAEIEPWLIKLSNEMTRKIFSRRQRGCGNYIVAGSFNLQSASLKTKIDLYQMVDRGSLTPNEWRYAMGLPPIPGADKPIRRLDTQVVTEGGES